MVVDMRRVCCGYCAKVTMTTGHVYAANGFRLVERGGEVARYADMPFHYYYFCVQECVSHM